MIKKIFLQLSLVTFCIASQELFYEALNCDQDISNFICIAMLTDIIVWDIRRGQSIIYSYSFHRSNAVGTTYSHSIGSFKISVEFSDANATHISSTLTVSGNPSSDYSISCNNILKGLRGPSLEDNILPSSLKIVQMGSALDEPLNFTATWNSSDNYKDFNYFISSYSTGSHSIDVQAINETSASFSLHKNTEYFINISVCPNSSHSSKFNFGRCPFIVNIQNAFLESYIIDETGVIVALLQSISSNRSWQLECRNNGDWDWSAINFLLITTAATGTSADVEIATVQHFSASVPEVNEIKYIDIPITASIASVMFILGVVFGVVGSILGIWVRKRNVKQSQNEQAPVYEDVNSAMNVPVTSDVADGYVSTNDNLYVL